MCLAAAYEHTVVLRRQSIPASESYRRISSPSFPDAFLRLEGCLQDPRCISDPQQRKSAGHNQPSGDSWTCTYIHDMSPDDTPRRTGNTSYSLHRAMIPRLSPNKKAVIKMYMQRYVWCVQSSSSRQPDKPWPQAQPTRPECSAVSRRAPILRVGYTTRASR